MVLSYLPAHDMHCHEVVLKWTLVGVPPPLFASICDEDRRWVQVARMNNHPLQLSQRLDIGHAAVTWGPTTREDDCPPLSRYCFRRGWVGAGAHHESRFIFLILPNIYPDIRGSQPQASPDATLPYVLLGPLWGLPSPLYATNCGDGL